MDGGEVELDSDTGDLRITDLTYNNTGEYTCVAETGAGSDNVTHTVTISGGCVGKGQLRESWRARREGSAGACGHIRSSSVSDVCCTVCLLLVAGPQRQRGVSTCLLLAPSLSFSHTP